MGAIISVECDKCGYLISTQFNKMGKVIPGYWEFSELFIGCGMASRDPYYYAALCNGCQEVVPINIEIFPYRCPVCKGTNVVAYYEPRMGEGNGTVKIPWSTVVCEDKAGKEIEYALYEDRKYLCPKCKSYELRFKFEGYWD